MNLRTFAALLLLLAAPLAAQEATPPAFTLDLSPAEEVAAPPPVPVMTPSVVEVSGVSVGIVPAPDATEAEVQAVAENSAEKLEDVASGEVSIAAATRDPTNSLDLGDDTGFFLGLSTLFGLVFGPLLSWGVERASAIDSRLGSFISIATVVLFYVLMYFLLHTRYPNLPQDLLAWIWTGAGSAAVGLGAKSGYRSWDGRGGAPRARPA